VTDAGVAGALIGGAVVSVVWMVAGAGVEAAGVAGWEHPTASARTMQSISANPIVSILFIPHGFTGGYMRVLSGEVLLSCAPVCTPEMCKTFFGWLIGVEIVIRRGVDEVP